MSDIIRLLPETVANQIAAGEVIQRPASAVKELVENAVDAGSTRIELITKDSGKTLIHIIDNGCGMSATDARLSFSRHATSKIRLADDLFNIRTKGFRGEALASIAAVAQVELKTRRAEDETGTWIQIDGNVVKFQEPIGMEPGTSIAVRNLFFNIPARRNFLKSDPIEGRHVIEEFERISLAHPEVSFHLNQNGVEIFKLPVSNLRQRIVNINGGNYNERLVPVHEETSLLTLSGFVGKPEFARKTRGEQYLFVNKRFIKDGYLHHAVTTAFEDLLPKDSYASYWIYIDIDPKRIDVNIHPTKTEIKFDDERSVYAIVRAAVKRSLGQYSVSPALDFERENTFDVPHDMRYKAVNKPMVSVNTDYNPFRNSSTPLASSGWEKVFEDVSRVSLSTEMETIPFEAEKESNPSYPEVLFQSGRYIICRQENQLILIDGVAAHQRILYNEFSASGEKQSVQQELFPQTIHFAAADLELVKSMQQDLLQMGFELKEFGGNTFVLHSLPQGIPSSEATGIIESILEQYKHFSDVYTTGKRSELARAIALSLSVKNDQTLSMKEMDFIVQQLYHSEKNGIGLNGKACMVRLTANDLSTLFK